MKSNAIIRIVIYTVIALMLAGILFCGLLVDTLSFGFGDSGNTVENGAAVNARDVKNIEIDWAAGSIDIVVGDTDQIHFSETVPEDSKYKMSYTLSGDTLKLHYGEGRVTIGFGNHSFPSKDLTITVPRDWVCKELEIDGAALDMTINGLTVTTFELDGASCDLEFSGSLDRVDIDGASNRMSFVCTNRISSLDVDGASCDLELTLPKGCGFRLQMEGLSCSMDSNLDYSGFSGNYRYGDEHCNIQIDGISCDVTIRESE